MYSVEITKYLGKAESIGCFHVRDDYDTDNHSISTEEIFKYFMDEIEYNLEISQYSESMYYLQKNEEDSVSHHFSSYNTDSDYSLFFINDAMLFNNREQFLNLYDYLPKEYIEMFDPNILPKYNGKLYGLPLYLRFPVLYYNKELLNEYNVKVPTTWDELLNSTKYILDEEKKKNETTNLVGYDGFFLDSDLGTTSLYELIDSYRDNTNSSFPNFDSKNAEEALNKLKDIKENISSNTMFEPVDRPYSYLENKNFIFFKYYYITSLYKDLNYTILPGNKTDLSVAVSTNINLAINKNISKESREIALKVLKHLTSKEIQKKSLLKFNKDEYFSFNILPTIPSLYDDKEVCEKVDCDLIKKLKLITRPVIKEHKYYLWSDYFREKIKDEFLNGNKTSSEVLKEIDEKYVDYNQNA
ncbi:periplasmic binding protein-like II [Anaeromyces robustus]|uniref:Periplasmic binding protein-like II n=1 Tax=Anaeromyces robustus TaxID=1754192 RepID=A0A1Y1X388_9FUNG|nr:periplasmic binding protein-like II [Anaeromyces robustus]|eukprot:ORX80271.1 periplasmic binding protein-like II [Anaeromyces robustus]